MPDSVGALRAAWRRQEAAMRAFVDALDEAGLQRVVPYHNLAGVAGESAMWEMLAHVVNHATYHRGQVTTLLRQLGATPPASMDLIAYYRASAAGPTARPAPHITIRPITPTDADTVARLHATSWRRAYRGMLSDAYLDGDLDAERRSVWMERLADPTFGQGWIAHADAEPVGFVFIRHERDAPWGVHVDNLHVLVAHQGLGIGRRLLFTVGEWASTHATDEPVHLWVIAANVAARGFYARAGGEEVELVDRATGDGGTLPEYRVVWRSARALREATRA
jgi:GNAT superfamily N-acetyltransferase